MSLLEQLRRQESMRMVDLALAETLRRLDPQTDERVLAAAALASLAIGLGHAAFDAARPQQLLPVVDAWPGAESWLAALGASRWVAQPQPDAPADPARPLVLEGGLLYLRRYREYERRLAAGLRRIAAGTPAANTDALAAFVGATEVATPVAPSGAREPSRLPGRGMPQSRPQETGAAPRPADGGETQDPLFEALFPEAPVDDRQAEAAALALRRALLLVTGGPGTGKTTTIARVLLLLLAQARAPGIGNRESGIEKADAPANNARGSGHDRDGRPASPPWPLSGGDSAAGQGDPNAGSPRPLRIALAAPTGRAAERMAESLRHAVAQLRTLAGVDSALIDALPQQASTLHRLLGTIPDSPRFRFDADTPLPYDVVVVDEASMVDLPLMCKLVEAVPDGARLVLLGDRDQLPSVEAGDVLAAIDDALGDAVDMEAPETQAPTTAAGAEKPRASLASCRVHLERSYRQSDALDLAPLAAAVRAGDADSALGLLRNGRLRGVHFHPDMVDPLRDAARDRLLAVWRAIADADDVQSALALAARARLLTALRRGPQGALRLNARIEEALAGAQRDPYFHGRLLLVTENSYRHRLFNGDIGVCLRDDAGAVTAWFAGGADGVRGFHPAALPAHTGAFAMTVHKAQGSEFDEVWLQLPRTDNRVLSRELLYTGLTRARSALHIAGSAEVIEAALSRHASRVSGLGWRLKNGADKRA